MQMILVPILAMAAQVVAATANESIPSEDGTNTTTKNKYFRGRHHYPPNRNLLLGSHSKSNSNGGHTSTYQGCLGYSDSELSQSWSFSSQAPSCSWHHATGGSGSSGGSSSNGGSGGSSSSGGSGSGGSGNGSSSSSSGGGGSGSSGGGGGTYDSINGDDDQIYGEYTDGYEGDSSDGNGGYNDDGYNGNTYNDDANGNSGNGNDEDGSENQNSNDDEVVVSNEDVYGGNSDYDPLDDFDIEVCDTYENLWIWDLALSCNNITSGGDSGLLWDSSGCNCSFAEELLGNGILSCEDVTLCPTDCEVCSTCLGLLGCGDGKPPRVIDYLTRPLALYILAAAVALLVFGAVAHYSRKRWRPQAGDSLNEILLDDSKTKPSLEITPTPKKKRQPPSFTMYIRGSDLSWRPLPSDHEYASSQQQQLQPTGTMSTASTGRFVLAPPSDFSSNSSDAPGSRMEAVESPTADSASRLHGERIFALDTLVNNNNNNNLHTEDPTGSTLVPLGTFLQMNSSGGVTSLSVSPMPTQEDGFSDEETSHREVVFEDLSPRSVYTDTGVDEATEKV